MIPVRKVGWDSCANPFWRELPDVSSCYRVLLNPKSELPKPKLEMRRLDWLVEQGRTTLLRRSGARTERYLSEAAFSIGFFRFSFSLAICRDAH